MCEPATLLAISAAVSVVSAGVGYMQQADAADNQEDAIRDNWAAQQLQIDEQQSQINDNALDEKSKRAKEATIERGRLRAIQGESGLSGVTQERIINESAFNEGTDIAAIEGNRKNSIKQSQVERGSLRANSQSQLNTIQQPSLIGTGLQIVGAGLNYQTGKNKLK
jgi:hypothetical protein